MSRAAGKVPIHLKLNSVPLSGEPRRYSPHSRQLPLTGGCELGSPRCQETGRCPCSVGHAKIEPQFCLLVVPRLAGGCAAVLCREVVLGCCALGFGRTRAKTPGFGHAHCLFQGSRGLRGVRRDPAGSWQDSKEPSTRKSRELWFRPGRTLPQEHHPGEASETDRSQFMPKERYSGEGFFCSLLL